MHICSRSAEVAAIIRPLRNINKISNKVQVTAVKLKLPHNMQREAIKSAANEAKVLSLPPNKPIWQLNCDITQKRHFAVTEGVFCVGENYEFCVFVAIYVPSTKILRPVTRAVSTTSYLCT